MSKEEDKKNVYHQTAWILNYQPKIEHQHIHMGNQTANDDADDVEDDVDEYEEVKEVKPQAEVKPKVKPDLPPADVFVNMVKAIVKEAAKKNGETIPAKPRGQVGEYVFSVDGERIAKMMDDLRKNHEAKINEFLSGTKKYDGVMIVAPFIGGILKIEELRARDLQLTDLEFAFIPYYIKPASAVRRLSERMDSAEAKILFGLLEGMLKKYPKS